MRQLFVQEGTKRLDLEFDDSVIIKVDGVEVRKPLVNVRSMPAGTRFTFPKANDKTIYVRLWTGNVSEVFFIQEGTFNVWKASDSTEGEVVK